MNGTWLAQTLADWNLHLARLNQPLRFGNQSVSRSKTNTAWLGQNLISIVQSALGAIGIDLSSSDLWQEIATTELGDIINGWNATVAPVAQNLPTGYLTWSDLTCKLSKSFISSHINLSPQQTSSPSFILVTSMLALLSLLSPPNSLSLLVKSSPLVTAPLPPALTLDLLLS